MVAKTYHRCARCTATVFTAVTIIGVGALTLVFLGRRDYMLKIPARMTTVLHPWVLGGIGLVLVVIGIGGTIGLLARLLMKKCIFK